MEIKTYEMFSGMTCSEVLAARAKSPNTKYYLALCYRDGRGVTRDEQVFRKLLKESAAEGSAMAIAYLDALANGCGGRARAPLFGEPREEKKKNTFLFLTRPAQNRRREQEDDALFRTRVEPFQEEASFLAQEKKEALEEMLAVMNSLKKDREKKILLEKYDKLSPKDRDEVLYSFMNRFWWNMADEYLQVTMAAGKDRICSRRTFEAVSKDLFLFMLDRKAGERTGGRYPEVKDIRRKMSKSEIGLLLMVLLNIYANEGLYIADRSHIRTLILQLIDETGADDAGYWPVIFCSYLKRGDFEIARALLARDLGIFDKEDFFYSVLNVIPMEDPGSGRFIDYLLDRNVRVDSRRRWFVDGYAYEESALALAVKKGYADLVRTMLDAGAEPEFGKCWAKQGWRHEASPLAFAIEKGKPQIAAELLAHGANAAKGRKWADFGILCAESPLFMALERHEIEIMRLLLEQGAPADTCKIWIDHGILHKRDGISMAVEQGTEYVSLLLRHGCGAEGFHRWKSLPDNIEEHGADALGKVDGGRRRREAPAEEEGEESWYVESALALAAQEKKSVPLVRLLLENGADLKNIGPLPSDWRSPMYRFLKNRGM